MPLHKRAFLLFVAATLSSGCGVFDTRTPEPPIVDGSQFLQPDTPEQVIQNIELAVGQKSPQNYRRSLSPGFLFTPTATAAARSSIWLNWSTTEEEQYFTTAIAATPESSNASLELNDRTFSVVDESTARLDATYVLRIDHSRQDAPTTAQGRLTWQFEKGDDGLWYLSTWVDQEIENQISWSDFKESFVA